MLKELIIDACALLNLLATGEAAAILCNYRLLVPPRVLAESIYSFIDDERSQKALIDETLLSRLGVLFEAVTPSSNEGVLFNQLAYLIDEGEAEALAIASTRRYILYTDDLRAIHVASQIGVDVITTLDLLESWSLTVSAQQVQKVVHSMHVRARYAPPKHHHLTDWYSKLLSTN